MSISARQVEEMIERLRAVSTDTQGIEVKESVLKLPSSIAETVSAFANGSGGLIILGLSEQRGFVAAPGFRAKPMADSLATISSDKLTPPIRPEIDIVDVGGTRLVVARVSELPPCEKPCYITDRGIYQGSYIRVSDGDRKLTAYEIDRLLEGREQPVYDDEVIGQSSRSDLRPELVDAVLSHHRAAHARIFAGMGDDEALVKLHVLGRADDGTLRPTLAGLVALGTYPQQYFPRLTVAFTAYPPRGADDGTAQFAEVETMAGPIPDMIEDTIAAVARGAARDGSCLYPAAAVREAVTNALVHRDYAPLARSTAVQVNLYEGRLEVITPGGLYGTVTVDTIGESGYSSARNQFLMSLLEVVPFGGGVVCENRGGGHGLIQRELERAGISELLVKDRISSFVLTMVLGEGGMAAEGPSDAIVECLRRKKEMSARQIADETGLPKRTVTYRLSKLVESGKVARIGRPRSPKQRYRLR